MKILMITPRFPYPPDKGDRLTILNYLKFFSKNNEVTLITFVQKGEDKFTEKVKPYCHKLISVPHNLPKAMLNCLRWSLLGKKPLQVSYYYGQPVMEKVINDCISRMNFDIIYCHTIRMAEYIINIQSTPKILAMQISMRLNYRRLRQHSKNILKKIFYTIESALVKNYEYNICRHFNQILLISAKDLNEIQEDRNRKVDNVYFLPHGVDHKYFSRNKKCEKDDNSIILTGNMGYPPNQDAVSYFCDEIFPIIKEHQPCCKLLVVGKDPPDSIKKYNDGKNIIITGSVKDIRPYFNKASVCVVPVRIAAGLQNKLLEGLSMELPVVATSNANEGIQAKDGEHLRIADTPTDFAEKVLELLNSSENRNKFAKNGRRFIEQQFTWEYFLYDLEKLMISMWNNDNKD